MVTSIASHRSFLQDVIARQAARREQVDPEHEFPDPVKISPAGLVSGQPTKANVINYVPEEETVRNDYTEWYSASGHAGANYILGAGDKEICEEYPALKRLMELKADLLTVQSHPPLYLQLPAISSAGILTSLSPHRFDAILLSPLATWEETAALPIRQLSADPSFVFLWVGRGDQDGLERGRECFAKWGFRRAEDIVWVKTNKQEAEGGRNAGVGGGGLFASQKEHCLMGIRGTVRRSTDTRFVHCNVDTDVMVWEEGKDLQGSKYPPYLYTLIENFCLGTRRLQLFAAPDQSRRGWVTASTQPLDERASTSITPVLSSLDISEAPQAEVKENTSASNVIPFDSASYPMLLPPKSDGRDVLPFSNDIDMLRPKSPQKRGRPSGAGPRSGAMSPTRGGSRPRGGPRMSQAGFQQAPPQFGMDSVYAMDNFMQPMPPEMINPGFMPPQFMQPMQQFQPGFNPMMMQGMDPQMQMAFMMANNQGQMPWGYQEGYPGQWHGQPGQWQGPGRPQ